MIPAYLYKHLYLLLVTVMTVYCSINYYNKSIKPLRHDTNNHIWLGYIFALAVSLFIGFRPISGYYFVDMSNYDIYFRAFSYGKHFRWILDGEDIIYQNLFYWLGAQRFASTALFVIMSLLYFMFAFRAMVKLFPKNALYGFIVFLGAFSTFSYGTNGIRAGVAGSFFLCALAFRDKKIKAIIYLLLSIGFHHSMIVPIAAFVCAWLYKNSKVYLAFWTLSLLIALFHITFFQELFSGMGSESAAGYLHGSDDWGGKTGFRYDFVLYSMLPVVTGYIALFKYRLKSTEYSFIYNTYLLTNAIWMLCMYASFTNRIAYLSWLMYPVVLAYPYFCHRFMPAQATRLTQLVWIHLLFTLAMTYIYYA